MAIFDYRIAPGPLGSMNQWDKNQAAMGHPAYRGYGQTAGGAGGAATAPRPSGGLGSGSWMGGGNKSPFFGGAAQQQPSSGGQPAWAMKQNRPPRPQRPPTLPSVPQPFGGLANNQSQPQAGGGGFGNFGGGNGSPPGYGYQQQSFGQPPAQQPATPQGTHAQTTVQPADIYSPEFTQQTTNNVWGLAQQQTLPSLLQRMARPGISTRGMVGHALPEYSRGLGQAAQAMQQIPFQHQQANAQNRLAGQVGRWNEMMGYEQPMFQAQQAWNQAQFDQQSNLARLLGTFMG